MYDSVSFAACQADFAQTLRYYGANNCLNGKKEHVRSKMSLRFTVGSDILPNGKWGAYLSGFALTLSLIPEKVINLTTNLYVRA